MKPDSDSEVWRWGLGVGGEALGSLGMKAEQAFPAEPTDTYSGVYLPARTMAVESPP